MNAVCISASNMRVSGAGSVSLRICGIIADTLSEQGMRCEIVDLRDYGISPCIGCGKCFTGKRCVCDAAFNTIYEKLIGAGCAIIVSPHYAPIPAKLCMLLEKMEEITFLHWWKDNAYKSEVHGLPVGIISHGGGADWALQSYKAMVNDTVANALATIQCRTIPAASEWNTGLTLAVANAAAGGGIFPVQEYRWDELREKIVCYTRRVADAAQTNSGRISMQELTLCQPCAKYAEQVMAYKAEMACSGDDFDGCAGLEDVETFEEWIDFEGRLKAKYKEGYVPSQVFLAIRRGDDQLVGIIDYRYPLSDFLLRLGGGVGYSVRPSERRKGCATEMLRLLRPICRENGEARVLVTCDKDNEASRRTILRNGGVLENEVADTAGLGQSGIIQRYWVPTDPAFEIIGYSPMYEDELMALIRREGEDWKVYWEEPNATLYREGFARSILYLALADGEVCGYLRCLEDALYVYACDLLVDQAYRGNGLGEKLLRRLKADYPRHGVYIMSGSDAYYEKLSCKREGSIYLYE